MYFLGDFGLCLSNSGLVQVTSWSFHLRFPFLFWLFGVPHEVISIVSSTVCCFLLK